MMFDVWGPLTLHAQTILMDTQLLHFGASVFATQEVYELLHGKFLFQLNILLFIVLCFLNLFFQHLILM